MTLQQLTDEELIAEIGGRLRRYRLQGNITQAELARRAGISLRTLGNIETGRDVQLGTVIRILRALGRLDSLDAFLPEADVSPMELLRSRGRPRQRAGGPRGG
jgi:transcriptional regulator with XRE-family HTH domain